MTIPIALTLVAVSVAAIASIMVAVQKMHINSLIDQLNDSYKNTLSARKHYTNEVDVSDKLQSQLDTADKSYDLLVKDNADFVKTLTQYSVNLINAKISEDKWKAIAKQNEIRCTESLDDYVKLEHQYTNLIAMPRRERDKLIAELRKSR